LHFIGNPLLGFIEEVISKPLLNRYFHYPIEPFAVGFETRGAYVTSVSPFDSETPILFFTNIGAQLDRWVAWNKNNHVTEPQVSFRITFPCSFVIQ